MLTWDIKMLIIMSAETFNPWPKSKVFSQDDCKYSIWHVDNRENIKKDF